MNSITELSTCIYVQIVRNQVTTAEHVPEQTLSLYYLIPVSLYTCVRQCYIINYMIIIYVDQYLNFVGGMTEELYATGVRCHHFGQTEIRVDSLHQNK